MRTRQARVGGSQAEWRSRAYAAINICWKQMSGGSDREERLAWIAEFLDIKTYLRSARDLSDEQLGLVAGEMKRLTGNAPEPKRTVHRGGSGGNVVRGEFGTRESQKKPERRETVFLASNEQAFTLEKLQAHLGWRNEDVQAYLAKRFKWATTIGKAAGFSFAMLTFKQATAATNALLHIAAHRYLKESVGDGVKVSRADVETFLPQFKKDLDIGDARA